MDLCCNPCPRPASTMLTKKKLVPVYAHQALGPAIMKTSPDQVLSALSTRELLGLPFTTINNPPTILAWLPFTLSSNTPKLPQQQQLRREVAVAVANIATTDRVLYYQQAAPPSPAPSTSGHIPAQQQLAPQASMNDPNMSAVPPPMVAPMVSSAASQQPVSSWSTPAQPNQAPSQQGPPQHAAHNPPPPPPPATTPVAKTRGPNATPSTARSIAQSPAPTLQPPPEGIYRSFEDLLSAVQQFSKEQGYGVVKLRASNYRDGKPTRYDLVCDRGGVKYSSTAKKRNPSTRKVDCPWRAKAVCEVQLSNQWRFAVQEARHNHEPRMPAVLPGQENTPIAQTLRTLANKIDRLSHDVSQGFGSIQSRMDNLEKRMENLEQNQANRNMMSAMGNPPLDSRLTGMDTSRMNNMDARVGALERANMMDRTNGMDHMGGMDDVEARLLSTSVM
ncbi:hypothetical protein PpBr36_03676 [Pyricularia pennisetigena]|uniref:hypothetical protein n=1 Tax=Pyricularia pennisetigena TaxID=1578925 RepID=UPI001152F333|nr:hypothetical protein PpBr36_03676 [Pyricularia pennisetigena]TLS30522.1 hypothetical protein PpBr36_03676 [Pyricularia pennisetigena]